MLKYLQSFVIGVLIGILLFALIPERVFGEIFRLGPPGLVFIVTVALVWMTPELVADVLRSRAPWSDQRLRLLAVPFIGGTIALFQLFCTLFITASPVASKWSNWMSATCDHLPIARQLEYLDLDLRMRLLSQCTSFVDAMTQLFAIGAATAMLVVLAFDARREGWPDKAFLTGCALYAVPFTAHTINVAIAQNDPGTLWVLLLLPIVCSVGGLQGMCIAFIARADFLRELFPWLA